MCLMTATFDQRTYRTTESTYQAHERRLPIYIICLSIFLLSLVIRTGLMVATQSYTVREDEEVVHVAVSLAQGHGFANAYGNGAPTAHMSPLYPLVLSVVYRAFGTGTRGEIVQEVLSCLLASLTWGLLPLLADICGFDRRVGLTAGLFGAVLIANRWAETKGSFEAAMAGLACMLVFTQFMKCWYSGNFSIGTAVLAGIASGLAMLVSASLGSIVASLLIAGYFLFRHEFGWKYLRFGVIAVAIIVVTLCPWALRNRLALGGWVWTRSNLPLELLLSNNDGARPMFKDNLASFYKYHPFASPERRALAKKIGELAFEQVTKHEVELWIRTHPKEFAKLTVQRMYYFWFPVMKRPVQTVVMAMLSLLSIPALLLLVRQRRLIGYALLVIWIVYPLMYYMVEEEPRYPYLIQWSKYLLAAYSAQFLWRHLMGQEKTVPDQVAA